MYTTLSQGIYYKSDAGDLLNSNTNNWFIQLIMCNFVELLNGITISE